MFTHDPEHGIVPAAQVAPHAPPVHNWPLGQSVGLAVVEHAPQWLLSVLVLISHPFAATPSQFAKPELHVPSPQTPAVHVAPAFAKAQRMPHPPQLFTLLPSTFVSQPFAGAPSQSPNPDAHTPTTHVDAAQACTLTLASEHVVVHDPQCAGSLAVRTQSPEQFVVPVPHVATHAPDEHT